MTRLRDFFLNPVDERERINKDFQDFYERLLILRREREGGMEPMLMAMATGYDYRKYQTRQSGREAQRPLSAASPQSSPPNPVGPLQRPAFPIRSAPMTDDSIEKSVARHPARARRGSAARRACSRRPSGSRASLQYLTKGYAEDPKTVINGALFVEDYSEMIVLKDLDFFSMCEHHILPFFGKAHVAYIPKHRIVGISKLARLVEVYARRLQVQERLTTQIANMLMEELDPHGVAWSCAPSTCACACAASRSRTPSSSPARCSASSAPTRRPARSS